jgi:methoxymalonate biosynthesis acyl carrier protein
MSSDLEEFVEAFLAQHLPIGRVRRSDDIFALGLVTSLFAVQLVEFVEAEFGFTVESEDLELDNFRSVSAIAAFVRRKSAAAKPAQVSRAS